MKNQTVDMRARTRLSRVSRRQKTGQSTFGCSKKHFSESSRKTLSIEDELAPLVWQAPRRRFDGAESLPPKFLLDGKAPLGYRPGRRLQGLRSETRDGRPTAGGVEQERRGDIAVQEDLRALNGARRIINTVKQIADILLQAEVDR